MIHIETWKCLGGGWRRYVAWTVTDYGYITAAFGVTETHARRRLLGALDARDAAQVVAR